MTWSAGDRLGRYLLVRPLGRGGMGEVWEAVLHGPHAFRKSVALKLLRAGVTEPAARAALLREARLGALLQHPNVVGTYELGEVDGVGFVSLELVRGGAVTELVRRVGRLPPGVVVELGVQVAAGLAHVHELVVDGRSAGLVHRDIKPANLLLDRTGLVKIADLGISVARDDAGAPAGTAGYAPPEQLDGRAEARSDVFALGATLHVLATGRRPFGTGSEAYAAVQRADAITGDEAFAAAVDAAVAGLGPILQRCLRASPDERPSARELGALLSGLRARQPAGPRLVELLGDGGSAVPSEPTRPSAVPTRVLAPGNVPALRDRFVGREDELADLAARVAGEDRLLVLLGAGGLGKTRLALEAARRLRPELPGGAWVFDLSEARSADGVRGALAAGLGLELDRADPDAQLGHVIRSKGRALVVLDNLEQCVDHLPDTLGRWLDAAPEATFLGTSRTPLRLRGEVPIPLDVLPLADAVALFLARAPRPIAEAEQALVRELCEAVEGLPLAIELAAARLRLLSLGAIRERLGLALLSGGGRDRPERHRSVEASLRWSYDLLGPAARSALGQLSVFEGGLSLEAAEAVLDPGLGALDALQELADAGLLRVDAERGRFSTLVVVGEFAAGVASPEERAAAAIRHGAFFAQRGSPAALAVLDSGRRADAAAELDNLLAAARRAVERGDGAIAAGTALAAAALLDLTGPAAVAVELLERVLAGAPDRRAELLRAAGDALDVVGRPVEARARFTSALAADRAAGDRAGEGRSLGRLGQLAFVQGAVDEARATLEAALAVHRDVGDRPAEANALAALASLDRDQGRTDHARRGFEAALAIYRQLGTRRLEAVTLGNLAILHKNRGAFELAREHHEAALALHRELGNRRYEGIVLGNLGLLAQDRGDREEARRLSLAALEVHQQVGHLRAEANVRGNLGVLADQEGRPDEARAHYDAALAIQRRVGDRRTVAVSLANIGSWLRRQGRTDAASTTLDEALGLARELREPRLEAFLLAELAVLAGARGDVAAELDRMEAACVAARASGDRRLEASFLTAAARARARRGDPAAAAVHAEAAVALARALTDPDQLAVTLTAVAEIAWRDGRAEEARARLDEARRLGLPPTSRGAQAIAEIEALIG